MKKHLFNLSLVFSIVLLEILFYFLKNIYVLNVWHALISVAILFVIFTRGRDYSIFLFYVAYCFVAFLVSFYNDSYLFPVSAVLFAFLFIFGAIKYSGFKVSKWFWFFVGFLIVLVGISAFAALLIK